MDTKKLILFVGVVAISGGLLSGCQQIKQIRFGTINKVKQPTIRNSQPIEKTQTGDYDKTKQQTEIEVKKEIRRPNDVQKAVDKVDKLLNELDGSQLNLDL